MLIDCSTCVARDIACEDCVVSVLLARPPAPTELDDAERDALGELANAGLVPPLRVVPYAAPGDDVGSESQNPPVGHGFRGIA